jgi:hypothetical protein
MVLAGLGLGTCALTNTDAQRVLTTLVVMYAVFPFGLTSRSWILIVQYSCGSFRT